MKYEIAFTSFGDWVHVYDHNGEHVATFYGQKGKNNQEEMAMDYIRRQNKKIEEQPEANERAAEKHYANYPGNFHGDN